MKFKKFGNKWVVSINIGEEIVETLKKFCEDNQIKLGTINGIGAVISDFMIWKLKNIIPKN
jgi:predicted DNA-binding protein with PD1-like motif